MFQAVTIADLQKHFPYLSWLTYINNFFAPHKVFKSTDTIILMGQKYFQNLGEFLKNTPKRDMANYIGWRLLCQSINSLSKKFKGALFSIKKALTGTAANNPDWLTCLLLTTTRFPLAMGALYVRSYFDASKKGKIEKIVDEMRETFWDILYKV